LEDSKNTYFVSFHLLSLFLCGAAEENHEPSLSGYWSRFLTPESSKLEAAALLFITEMFIKDVREVN
jgi:hypothetical protein